MLIRLRSRDGLERVEVPPEATLGQLVNEISTKLGIPAADITLSRNPALLITKEPGSFQDLRDPWQTLRALGMQQGELVHMFYPFDRQVAADAKASVFGSRDFGTKMTVQDLIAKQTRIERQETSKCASVSFSSHAANAFQQYVMAAHAFSIKRGGLLYGTFSESGEVSVEAIYEPPQEGSAETLRLERQTEEEQRADLIATLLGWRKVGWIFTQAKSMANPDVILTAEEVTQMAAIQAELGETAATAVVSIQQNEDGSATDSTDVQFEAFQLSDQAVKLWEDGWIQPHEKPTGGSCTLRNPKEPKKKDPVIVAGKDVGEVDNNYFLVPVKILDHEGSIMTEFAIENRLVPQGPSELRQHLQRFSSKPYVQRLSDFHVLLYLSKQPNFDLDTDITVLAQSVQSQTPIPEGYTLIIDSLAQR
ncbi:hypothetical protein WJX73_007136 [Symbiochloris irregularis]|uniref:ubiquitinyl hydrolase 1 n=1 Tax=Symbiochloris irregularis TaxID=706552 RepID=A0AAW1P9C7_9CHLO